jgi:hypothetical protein
MTADTARYQTETIFHTSLDDGIRGVAETELSECSESPDLQIALCKPEKTQKRLDIVPRVSHCGV